MNSPSLLPRILVRVVLLVLAFAAPVSVQAQLTWEPGIGWQIDGEPVRGNESADTPATALVLMNMGREAHEDGHLGNALRHYKRVTEEFATTIFAPEAHFQSALIRMERKQWTRAFDSFQAIVDNHPEYPRFGEVIHKQFDIADGLRQGERLRLFWTIPGFRSPERAVEYFEKIVENAPFSKYAPVALLHAATLEAERGKLDEAIDLYDRFISDYPKHENVADAYFGLAEAFSNRVRGPAYDQGANREAISYYEDFSLLYPRHPRAAEAENRVQEMSEVLAESRIILGDFYFHHRDNFPAARVFYNEAITIAPRSATAEDAREKLARVEEKAEETR